MQSLEDGEMERSVKVNIMSKATSGYVWLEKDGASVNPRVCARVCTHVCMSVCVLAEGLKKSHGIGHGVTVPLCPSCW